MKIALLRLFSSMKTWTLIFGVTLTPATALLAKHGFNISDDTVKLLAELMSLGFTALLVAQGLTDQGKEAAKARGPNVQNVAGGDATLTVVPAPTEPAPKQPDEKGAIPVSLLLGLVFLMLFGLAACSWFKSTAAHEGQQLVDCALGQLGTTVKELRPLADDVLVEATGGDGQVDFARLESAGRNFAGNVGMCLFADAVTRALQPAPADPKAPKASLLEAKPESLRAVFERLRAQHAPGKRYKTEAGTL